MFFDIGWPELMLIGAVALVVIGPKDLPAALRVAGAWVRKARTMSREFQSSVEQMIRDAELDTVQRDLRQATEFDIEHHIREAIPDHFDEPPLPFADPPAVAEATTPELPLAPGESIVEPSAEELIEPELPFAEKLPPRAPVAPPES
jgi:sec-independent protein translocase protein TatB